LETFYQSFFVQFYKKFLFDGLLDFLPSHESGRATQHGHTQTKLKANQLTDESRLVQFEKVQVIDVGFDITDQLLIRFLHLSDTGEKMGVQSDCTSLFVGFKRA
jgi:hypothetical protein